MKREEMVSEPEAIARRKLVAILDKLSKEEQRKVIRWMQKLWLHEKGEDFDA